MITSLAFIKKAHIYGSRFSLSFYFLALFDCISMWFVTILFCKYFGTHCVVRKLTNKTDQLNKLFFSNLNFVALKNLSLSLDFSLKNKGKSSLMQPHNIKLLNKHGFENVNTDSFFSLNTIEHKLFLLTSSGFTFRRFTSCTGDIGRRRSGSC